MQIDEWKMDNVGRLADFYNRQIEPIPYCYPVSEDEFQSGIVWESNDRNYLHDEVILTIEVDGQILGFSHVALLDRTRNGKSEQLGIVRFFVYEPGQQAAGQALIDASEDYFRSYRIANMHVYTGGLSYPFYHVGRAFLTDRWGHVFGLLGMNGYKVVHGQVFMDWRNFDACEPVAPSDDILVSVSHREKEQGERPGLKIEIFKNDQSVGQCRSSSLGVYQRASEAQDQFYVAWLGVNDSMQRKGLGRYMMDRTHWEMKQLGYRHAVIGTELDNYRAMCLYLNDGYRLLFTEYQLGKEIDLENLN